MGPWEHRKEVASIGMEPGIAERDQNHAIVTNKTSHRPQHRNRIVIMLETIDGYDDVRRLSQFSHELTTISDACLSGCSPRHLQDVRTDIDAHYAPYSSPGDLDRVGSDATPEVHDCFVCQQIPDVRAEEHFELAAVLIGAAVANPLARRLLAQSSQELISDRTADDPGHWF